MDPRQRQINIHNYKVTAKAILDRLGKIGRVEQMETDAELRRSRRVAEAAIKAVAGTNPDFVSIGALDRLASNLSTVDAQLAQIQSHKDEVNLHPSFLSTLSPALDGAVEEIDVVRASEEPITKKAALEGLGQLELDANALGRKTKSLFEAEIRKLSSEVQTLEKTQLELQVTLREEKLRADKLIVEFQEKFHTGEEGRAKAFSLKLENEYDRRISEFIRESRKKYKEVADSYESGTSELIERTKALVKSIEKHAETAEVLAQAIARKGLNDQFFTRSKVQNRYAIFWQVITMVAAVSAIVLLAIIVFSTIDSESNVTWQQLLPKLLLTGIIGSVARWAAKLEKYYRNEATQNARLSLELATITPFISTLSDDSQKQITEALVDRYFLGQSGNPTSTDRDDIPFPDALSLIRRRSAKETEE